MPSAAGIIIATGAMTIANHFLQSQAPQDPKSPVASRVNFKVIPATAIAAGLFYMLEQASEPIATGLAWIVFITAFAFPAEAYISNSNDPQALGKVGLSPLGTLLGMTGNGVNVGWFQKNSGLPPQQ